MRDEIRKWFVAHEGGEFAVPPQDDPFLVVPAPPNAQYVLYTTKPRSMLAALSRTGVEFPCGVIGRYGLPAEVDLDDLKALMGKRRCVFVGDADPCDILIFGWLRSRTDISFRGLSDLLYKKCGVTLEKRFTITQSDAEIAAMPLVARCVADFTGLLGSHCAELLASGRKVEVESLVTSATLDPMVLAEAICN